MPHSAKWYNLCNQRKIWTGLNERSFKLFWPHWSSTTPSFPFVSWLQCASPMWFWLQSWALTLVGNRQYLSISITPCLFIFSLKKHWITSLLNCGVGSLQVSIKDGAVFPHNTSVLTQPFTTIAWRHLYRVKRLNCFFHETEKKENWHISKPSLVLKTLVYRVCIATDSNYCLSKIIPGKNWFDLAGELHSGINYFGNWFT